MKDAFFRWWGRISEWIYVQVTKAAYYILTRKKCRAIPKLSNAEHKQIQQYWKKVYGKRIPTFEYAWYEEKGREINPQIIPDMIWHTAIEPFFTNIKMEKGFCDKNYFETIVGKKNSPETVCRCVNSQLLDGDYKAIKVEALCDVLTKEEEVICKPSIDSGGGRAIVFLSRDNMSAEKIKELIDKYKGNFIIQKVVKQHEFLNQFNNKSLNTMRILSFLYKGNVHFLSAFLRIGGAESRLDNVSSGGYYIQIQKEGYLDSHAVKEDLVTHDLIKFQPNFGQFNLTNVQVPKWNEIVQLVTDCHYKLAHFQIINWDIALNSEEIPIIIEYNLLDSSPSFHQINIGPIFGDLTEEVLREVGKKQRNESA